MLDRFFNNTSPIRGVELFATAMCNLQCNYCYIPHDPAIMKELSEQIKKALESGLFLDTILKHFDPKHIETMSHWGKEPFLTLPWFNGFYNKAIEVLPRLHRIILSTNMTLSPKILVDFLISLPIERKFTIDIQCSLDGPTDIHDINRIGSSSKHIVANVLKLARMLPKGSLPHSISISIRPTLNKQSLALLRNYEFAKQYFSFFNDISEEFQKIQSHINKITISNPIPAFPGFYTTQDGIDYNNFYMHKEDLAELFPNLPGMGKAWGNHLSRIQRFRNEYYNKYRMFTCSGGDDNFSIGEHGQIHRCHRTFFMDNANFHKYAPGIGCMEGHDFRDGYELVKKTIIQPEDLSNDKRVLKSLLDTRALHDFNKNTLSMVTALAVELAYANQISKCFRNPNVALWLGIIVNTVACPLDNIIVCGASGLNSGGMLRLFGNGVAQRLIVEAINDNQAREQHILEDLGGC